MAAALGTSARAESGKPLADVAVLGAEAQRLPALTTASDHVHWTFLVEAENGTAPADLQVDARLISSPDGAASATPIATLAGEVGEAGRRSGRFDADLPRPGAYEFSLTLGADEARKTFTLSVQRAAPKFVLVGLGPTPTEATTAANRTELPMTILTEAGEISDVTIRAAGLVGPDGRAVDLLVEGRDEPLSEQRLSEAGLAFTLSAALPVAGVYKGAIEAIYPGGRWSQNIQLTRSAPIFSVAGTENESLKLASKRTDFSEPVTIRLKQGGPLHALTLRPLSLTSPGGEPVELLIDDVSAASYADLETGDVVTPILTAQVPETGVYRGEISLDYSHGSETLSFEITRDRLPDSVEISATTIGRIDIWPYALFGETVARSIVRVKETAGRNLTLSPPSVARLSRTQGDVTNIGAPPRHVSVKQGDTTLGPDHEITLAGGGEATFTVEMTGFDHAGQYDGAMTVAFADHPDQEVVIQMFARDSGFVAAFFVLAGVLLAIIFRAWLNQIRPIRIALRKLSIARRNYAALAASAAPLTHEEKEVFAILQSHIDAKQADLAVDGADADVATLIELLKQKKEPLRQWMNLHRIFADLALERASANLGPQLNALKRTISREALSNDELDALNKALSSAREAVKNGLSDLVDNFKNEMDSLKSNIEGEEADRAWRERVSSKVDEAKRELSAGNFRGALTCLQSARRGAAGLLALMLEARLGRDGPEWAPADDDATAIRTQLEIAGDEEVAPADAVRAYRLALGRYLNLKADWLSGEIASKQTSLITDQPPLSEEWTTRKIRLLTDMKGGLVGVPEKIAGGHLAAAETACAEAEDARAAITDAIAVAEAADKRRNAITTLLEILRNASTGEGEPLEEKIEAAENELETLAKILELIETDQLDAARQVLDQTWTPDEIEEARRAVDPDRAAGAADLPAGGDEDGPSPTTPSSEIIPESFFGRRFGSAAGTRPDRLGVLDEGPARPHGEVQDVTALNDEITALNHSIRRGDWLFQSGLAVIAVSLGLSVLWAGDATWGGPADYLLAFFWGLGLQGIGNTQNTFTGIPSLRDKFV